MSSVHVHHNVSSLKVPVNGSTTLKDVLNVATKHYNLDPERYTLQKDYETLDLSVPWRFLNMAQNSKFELVEMQVREDNAIAEPPKTIRIRFQIVDRGSFIKELSNNTTLDKALQEIIDDNQLDFAIHNAHLQCFGRQVPAELLASTTLNSLGIQSASNIKVLITDRDQIAQPHLKRESEESVESPEKIQLVNEKEITEPIKVSKPHELHKPQVYLPPKTSVSERVRNEIDNNIADDDYELTIEHAKLYQSMLAKQTGSLGGPLMTQRMRQMQDNVKNNKHSVDECFIRFKFPDLTQIEISFSPEDTMHTVYNIVRELLISTDLNFGLYRTHPHMLLDDSELRLVADLQFGAKTALLFEPNNKSNRGPYLRGSVIDSGESISNIIDPKINTTADTETEKEPSPTRKVSAAFSSSSTGPKKIPKWLRLSKK